MPKNIQEFFQKADYLITSNNNLREPQIGAYQAAYDYFKNNNDTEQHHAIIQLPVGCGKTGLMSILPFSIAKGRVLIIAPNLEIRKNIYDELDINSPKCFWKKTGVIKSFKNGPFAAVVDAKANIHDCNASHFVITNIQQLASRTDKWLSQFSDDYFDMILVDEGHHNVAPSWERVFQKFSNAKVISLTATPIRSDGVEINGNRIYHYSFANAMRKGYIKQITSNNVAPSELRFTLRGEEVTHTLESILNMRENDWYSKGVAIARESNISIVDASIQWLNYLRQTETKHQIIAVACSVDHAREIRSLYEERGISAREIHSGMSEEERLEVLRDLRNFHLDCIVQVQLLGEGFDHKFLSLAAIFRPYRSLSPYIQFVGRIMRVIHQNSPGHPDNKGIVVSHVGLNIDRHWDDFKHFDREDQEIVTNWLNSEENTPPGNNRGARRRITPGMVVLEEIIDRFITDDFIDPSDDALIDNIIASLNENGISLDTLGLTKETLKQRILSDRTKADIEPEKMTVSPQNRRKQERRRLNEQEKSLAKRLLEVFNLSPASMELLKVFPSGGIANNYGVAIKLVTTEVNKLLDISSKQREDLSLEQLQTARAALDNIGDSLEVVIREKLGK
jgi:superfamily II DNA or RNA helicase